MMRHLLAITILSLSACEKDAPDVRYEEKTIDGIEIELKVITLEPNTEYILRLSDPDSQRFIVDIGEGDNFSFAKLSGNPNTPTNWPITITGSSHSHQAKPRALVLTGDFRFRLSRSTCFGDGANVKSSSHRLAA